MTFLNPLYLIALAAASIPIIIHLLNLRKSRVIDFSTLTFLKELQKSKIRRLKLRQLLLLALRTLIIICIVLAFSRPAFRGSVGNLLGSHAKTSVVIILDDSFSMLASDDGGQFLKQAKARAKSIIGLLQPGDEVALIKTSSQQKDQIQFTAAHNAVLTEIDQIQPSYAHTFITDALTAAQVSLSRSQNINKEIYVITDEQRSHFISSKKEWSPAIQLFDDRVKVFLSPIGINEINNTAVVSVQILNSLFEKNRPVTITTTILNNSIHAMRGEVVSIYLGGERVMQKSIDIDAGARKEVEFVIVPKSTGFIEGFIELEDDVLPEDNRRYFSFHIPEKVHVLLASEKPEDVIFLKAALSSSPSQSSESTFDISTVNGNQIASVNIKKYDVAIVVLGKSITSDFHERLASYIKDGGGVFIFPANDGDEPTIFSQLFSQLQLPSGVGISGAKNTKSSYAQFGKIDFAHPVFNGIFQTTNEKKPPQVESPKIYYNLQLKSSEKAQTIISLSNGSPFLIDYTFGTGKVLICSAAPHLDWTDFPLKGLFVPLINRSVYYLASRDFNSLSHLVGETFEVMLPNTMMSNTTFTLNSPSKKETRLVPKTLSSGLYFPMSNLNEPGNFVLKSNNTTIRVIPVNVDPSESDLSKLTTSERDAFWKSLGVKDLHVIKKESEIQRTVQQTRFGIELWKYFIIAAIVCALLEMIVARDVKQKQLALAT